MMRIFVALDIDDVIRDRIHSFIEGVRDFAPDARWIRPESLHITLKFIGEKSFEAVEKIKYALRTVQCEGIDISFREFGFFPSAQAPRVFWIGIEGGPQLTRLAAMIEEVTTSIGIIKEEHAFSPHLTLARAGGSGSPHWGKGDAPNRNFEKLQKKLESFSAAEFGKTNTHEFFLYQSELGQGGSQYTKLERFELR